jgi:hypothetical protein
MPAPQMSGEPGLLACGDQMVDSAELVDDDSLLGHDGHAHVNQALGVTITRRSSQGRIDE